LKRNSLEIALYVLIFCLAAALRFANLADAPLTDHEASAALNALHLSEGAAVAFDDQAGYSLLTSVLFYFLHAGEFWARFLPALIGSLMVFAPLLLRGQLGALPALILAAGLAIDPALVILSRTAGGSILGIAFFLCALGLVLSRQPLWAGICAALALAGGPSTWFGAAALAGTLLVLWIRQKTEKSDPAGVPLTVAETLSRADWLKFLVGFIAAAFLAFSLFLQMPSGLGTIFSGLAGFVRGWAQPPALSINAGLFSLLFYEGLPLILGIVALVIAFQKRDRLILALSSAAVLALVLFLLYPGRGFALMPWISIPFWILLAKYVLDGYSLQDVELTPYLGLLALVLVVVVFSTLNLKGLFSTGSVDLDANKLRIASVVGSALIVIVASGLVIWGWSVNTAAKALFAALFILSLGFNTATLGHILAADGRDRQEVWLGEPFSDADLFVQTVSDYRNWNIGSGAQMAKLQLVGLRSYALEWALRAFENVEQSQSLPADSAPQMIVTAAGQQLSLQDEYTGQDFVLSRQPYWDELDAWGWLRWFFLRKAPYADETLILWVKTDQFPGYDANALTPE
jgi:hypothetical protein